MRRVLVCGGRDYRNRENVYSTLRSLYESSPFDVVIHGAASGVDTFADEWAVAKGLGVISCPADWKKHGRAAGPIRNQSMLDVHTPHLVVAFPGGRGTADMVRRAKAAGVTVLLQP